MTSPMTSPVTSPVTSPASAPATAPSAPASAPATTKADASADATTAEAPAEATTEAVPAVFKDGEKVMCSPVTHEHGQDGDNVFLSEPDTQVTISGAPVWDEDLGGFCYQAS